MDPRTGYPAQGMISVSVVAPRAIDSEAWTKPVYVNGRSWMEQAQRSQPALRAFRVFACEDAGSGDPRCGWLASGSAAKTSASPAKQ
jgi:thiamine biosynthesis lipoprotein